MFITRQALPRRTFLRGLGTAVALPFLDAMTPALARAQSRKAPVRMAFVYVPNGIDMRHWNPRTRGRSPICRRRWLHSRRSRTTSFCSAT